MRGAAAVYCEDTRNTLKLMNHFEIKKTLISCHEHNEEQRANEIAERVRGGEAIAFVSDAGRPGSVIRAAVLSGFLLKTISRLRCSRRKCRFDGVGNERASDGVVIFLRLYSPQRC